MTAALDALLARLDALIAKRIAQVEPFRAVVKSVTGGGLVTIRRVESAADDAEEYARVAGFTLAVDDEVVCMMMAGKPVVVGRLQRTAISDLDLTVQDLTITGSLTGGGATTLDGDVTLGNAYADQIYIAGRLRTAAGLTAPTLTNGGATVIGTSPTVSITGTDTTGQIAVTTGTSVSGTGTLVTFNFNTARANSSYTVMLTPQSQAAGQQFTRINVGTRSTTTWNLNVNTALSSSTTYQWFYWIINYA